MPPTAVNQIEFIPAAQLEDVKGVTAVKSRNSLITDIDILRY